MIGDEGTKVPGLGVIVYREGAPVYRHVAGASYMPEGKRNAASAITEKTRFRVASVSKMFTAFAIMQLVEQHRLSLDSDVCRLLDLSIPTKTQDGPITVAMLLSHTSSLRDGTLYAIPPTSSVRDFLILPVPIMKRVHTLLRKRRSEASTSTMTISIMAS